jgi:hypothetical protein
LIILFWCLVWPGVLTALHKRSVSKILLQILEEVNGEG